MDQKEERIEYHDIVLTDVMMHAVAPRKPISWLRAIWLVIKNKLPKGRFYTKDFSMRKDGKMKVTFPLPPEIREEIRKAEAAGKKIRILTPKGGLPVYLATDAIEKLNAHNKFK